MWDCIRRYGALVTVSVGFRNASRAAAGVVTSPDGPRPFLKFWFPINQQDIYSMFYEFLWCITISQSRVLLSRVQFARFLDVGPPPPILPRVLKWIHRRVHNPASEANLSSCHVPWSRLKSVMGCSVPSWAHPKMAARQTVTLLPVLSTRFYGMICALTFKAWKKD